MTSVIVHCLIDHLHISHNALWLVANTYVRRKIDSVAKYCATELKVTNIGQGVSGIMGYTEKVYLLVKVT